MAWGPSKSRSPFAGAGNKAPAGAKPRRAPLKRPELPTPEVVAVPESAVFRSVGAIVRKGLTMAAEQSRIKGAEEAYRLRGGTVGANTDDGHYVGTCKRAALARYLGAEAPRQVDKWNDTQLMLDAGRASEDCFAEPLLRALPAGLKVLREEEFQIAMHVAGQPFSGREDIVITDDAGKPKCLVELKNVSSLPTELLFQEEAKLKHVIQLANYMLRTGLPGQLWYTSRIIHSLPDWPWVTMLLPKRPGDGPGSEYVDWSAGKTPKPTKITPFMLGFHLAWHGDRLYYTRAADFEEDDRTPTRWCSTVITKQGIDSWYADVVKQLDTKVLAGPPRVASLSGKEKSYKECRYCDWAAVCKATGDGAEGFEPWKEVIESLVPNGVQRGVATEVFVKQHLSKGKKA